MASIKPYSMLQVRRCEKYQFDTQIEISDICWMKTVQTYVKHVQLEVLEKEHIPHCFQEFHDPTPISFSGNVEGWRPNHRAPMRSQAINGSRQGQQSAGCSKAAGQWESSSSRRCFKETINGKQLNNKEETLESEKSWKTYTLEQPGVWEKNMIYMGKIWVSLGVANPWTWRQPKIGPHGQKLPKNSTSTWPNIFITSLQKVRIIDPWPAHIMLAF